jgi:hypothetical protein
MVALVGAVSDALPDGACILLPSFRAFAHMRPPSGFRWATGHGFGGQSAIKIALLLSAAFVSLVGASWCFVSARDNKNQNRILFTNTSIKAGHLYKFFLIIPSEISQSLPSISAPNKTYADLLTCPSGDSFVGRSAQRWWCVVCRCELSLSPCVVVVAT